MKQLKIASFVLTASLLVSSTALAQGTGNQGEGSVNSGPGRVKAELRMDLNMRASSTPRRDEMKSRLEGFKASSTNLRIQIKAELDARKASSTQLREAAKLQFEARRASSTERRVEMQQGLAKRKAEHVGKVLMATVERLEKILARIETRIAKIEANGGSVTDSKEAVADAKLHLAQAKVSLEAFSSIDLTGDKANENFGRIRAAAAEVKAHLKEAHLSMMLAVRSLKSGEGNGRATSTRATSTSQ